MTTYLQRAHQAEQVATPSRWEFDEPSNWQGLSARIHPAGSGDPIAQISLSGWGKRKGRANAALIVKTRNDFPSLLAVVAAAQKRLQGGHSDACGVPCTCGQERLRASLAALEALP